MKARHAIFAVIGIFLGSALAWAQGTDELWESSMSMQMEGMSMPAMTQKICQKKGAAQDNAAPLDKDCKVTDSRRSGNKQMFSFVCDGKDGKYSGSGETETLGKDSYRGKMKSSGVRDGEKFEMDMAFSGKRVGNCTWEDPQKQVAQMQGQHAAMMAKECDKMILDMQPLMFFGSKDYPQDALICKDRKADFCANAKKVAQTMRDPAGFTAVAGKRQNWRDAMTACGIDPASISGPVCKSAVDRKDWDFVNRQCKTEATALRKAHCTGRTYTTVDAAYRELCVGLGGLSYTADEPSADKAKPAAAEKPKSSGDAAKDKLKEGTDKLKKFLKF